MLPRTRPREHTAQASSHPQTLIATSLRIIPWEARAPTIILSRERSNLAKVYDGNGHDGKPEFHSSVASIRARVYDDEEAGVPHTMKYSAALIALASGASAGTTVWSGSFNSYSTAADFDKCSL